MAKESLRDRCCAVNCSCSCHVPSSHTHQLQAHLFHLLYQLQALIGTALACDWEECSASVRHDYFMVMDDYCQDDVGPKP